MKSAAWGLALSLAHTAVMFFILFSFFSCGPKPDRRTHKLEVNIFGGSQYTDTQFDEEEGLLLQILSPAQRLTMSGIDVYFSDYETVAAQRGHPVSGYALPIQGISHVVDQDCLSATAYTHELFHHAKYRADHDVDAEHKDAKWRYIDYNVLQCGDYFEFGRLVHYKEIP